MLRVRWEFEAGVSLASVGVVTRGSSQGSGLGWASRASDNFLEGAQQQWEPRGLDTERPRRGGHNAHSNDPALESLSSSLMKALFLDLGEEAFCFLFLKVDRTTPPPDPLCPGTNPAPGIGIPGAPGTWAWCGPWCVWVQGTEWRGWWTGLCPHGLTGGERDTKGESLWGAGVQAMLRGSEPPHALAGWSWAVWPGAGVPGESLAP